MVFRRRKRRRSFRGRGRMRKRGRFQSMYKSRSIYRQPMTAYKVRRIIGQELKHSVQQAEIQPSIGGNFLSLTDGIPQGVLSTNRIGNWIQPAVLHGHIELTGLLNSEASEHTAITRMAFLRWKEDTTLNPPSTEEIMESKADPQGPYNFGGKGKFDILWTKVVTTVNENDNGQFSRRFRFYLRLGRGPQCIYSEATPMKYHLFFFALSNSPITEEGFLRISTVLRYGDA